MSKRWLALIGIPVGAAAVFYHYNEHAWERLKERIDELRSNLS